MGDLERLAGRAGAGHAGARDLVAIADGLERLPQLASRLQSSLELWPNELTALQQPEPALAELAASIRQILIDAAPLPQRRRADPRRRRSPSRWPAQPAR